MDHDVLLSTSEVSRLLKVSTTALRLLVKTGRLVAVNADSASAGNGRGLRFKASAIRKQLDAERRERFGRRRLAIAEDVQSLAPLGDVARSGR